MRVGAKRLMSVKGLIHISMSIQRSMYIPDFGDRLYGPSLSKKRRARYLASLWISCDNSLSKCPQSALRGPLGRGAGGSQV